MHGRRRKAGINITGMRLNHNIGLESLVVDGLSMATNGRYRHRRLSVRDVHVGDTADIVAASPTAGGGSFDGHSVTVASTLNTPYPRTTWPLALGTPCFRWRREYSTLLDRQLRAYVCAGQSLLATLQQPP